MKHMAAGILGILAFQAHGVKAFPEPVEYRQENGRTIEIVLHGDENFRFATTPEGVLLMLNERGGYEYAVMGERGVPVASGVDASETKTKLGFHALRGDDMVRAFEEGKLQPFRQVGERSIKKQTRAQGSGEPKYRYTLSAFPTVGAPHSLVVLVEYPGVPFLEEDPKAYFEEFLNGDDFNANGATGSCRKYYSENSGGLFTPTFDVYGPVMMKNPRSYYGGGNEANACQMVVEAVEALDGEVDFSVYDHNDDGYVDSIYIIYAGRGENTGGPAESVWPYSWELEEEGVSLEADGVKFNTYGCSNEVWRDGKIEGIGTFTHEFGHVLGLPDLYNTQYADSSTPSDWSVMDSGNYLDNCRTPCNLSSFERYSLGWLSPEELKYSGDYSLEPLPEGNSAFIMPAIGKEDEFFIMEYRRKSGWDSFLPAPGMLLWHIDFDQQAWDSNVVNNTYTHQRVILVRADATPGPQSLMSDPFPGSWNITRIDDTSRNFQPFAKGGMNVTALYDMREEDESGKFSASTKAVETSVDAIGDAAGVGIHVSGSQIFVSEGSAFVFDASGRRVGVATPQSPLSVGKGVYIVDGRKIII